MTFTRTLRSIARRAPAFAMRRLLGLAAALLAVSGLLAGGPAPVPAIAAPQYKLYLPFLTRNATYDSIFWGALMDGAHPPDAASLQPGGLFYTFESRAGKGMSILHWGQPWKVNGIYQPFQLDYMTNTRAHGSIPLLDWGAGEINADSNQPEFKLSAIAAGNHDAYLIQWATAAKLWGHPFFLRPNWEMNGNWQYPWSVQLNGNTPNDFILAWRHIHDVFQQVGATNATWVWCPNISGATSTPYNSIYPGDTYVDWTCIDGFNKYPAWIGFNTVFSGSGINWLYNSYALMLAVAPSKPIMIGETGSLEAGDGGAQKAAWLTDAFLTQLPVNFPRVRAVVYFNWGVNDPAQATLPIESSTASINAFANAIGSSYYKSNTFANFDVSPIPAP